MFVFAGSCGFYRVYAAFLGSALGLSACAATGNPSLPSAKTPDLNYSVAATHKGVNLAMFIGMDDYVGDTLADIRETFEQLAKVGSHKTFGIFLSGDSDVVNDGFRTKVLPNQVWGQGFIDIGEMKTGQTPDLRNFLSWAGDQAPDRLTHLVLGSHGGGYSGLMFDYDGARNPNAPSTSLTLQRTFKALSKGYAGSRLESVTFDACMMATIEVGEAIKGIAKVYTGSEDFAMGGSRHWAEIAGSLARGESSSSNAFGHAVAAAIVRDPGGSRTWSAIRLDANWDALVRRVDRMAKLLIAELKTNPGPIRAAASQTRQFSLMAEYREHYGDFFQRDLVDFCQALRKNSQDLAIAKTANDVESAVKQVLVGFQRDQTETMANGLAIYLPQGKGLQKGFKLYEKTAFANHTHWDEFLLALNAAEQ